MDFEFERTITKSSDIVIGVDEAGRGPLAGPVVAAAIMLDDRAATDFCINDSKALSTAARKAIALQLQKQYKYGIGIACVREIEQNNILQATMLAMQRAVQKLIKSVNEPIVVIIDGNMRPVLLGNDLTIYTVTGGDKKCISIAAASILAKVHRDDIMFALHADFPMYDWHRNKGYGTNTHLKALKNYGPTEHHRIHFLRKILPMWNSKNKGV